MLLHEPVPLIPRTYRYLHLGSNFTVEWYIVLQKYLVQTNAQFQEHRVLLQEFFGQTPS